MNHDSFLRQLLQTFDVYLVGKCADKNLALGEDTTFRTFLPDLHWMSRACVARYVGGYSFNGKALMSKLLPLLEGSEVFQLGDRFDLWRESSSDDEDILAVYDRVNNDPDVRDLSGKLDDLGTKYIRGNHDTWLKEVEARRPYIRESQEKLVTGNDRIQVLHGHQFDSLEIPPTAFKAEMVRLVPNLKPLTYDIGTFFDEDLVQLQAHLRICKASGLDLYPRVTPVGARLLTSLEDIAIIESDSATYLDVSGFPHGESNGNDPGNYFEHISYLSFADEICVYDQKLPYFSLHVVGHTHQARLLFDYIPGTTLAHLTMDCGGWIENCVVKNSVDGQAIIAPSVQIGVQCQNDVRIYQLSQPSRGPALMRHTGA
jgi:UDP-2,3-diacylglucosamine pyrophosphatase LpxH